MRVFLENYIQNLQQPVDINSIYKSSISEATASRYQRYLSDGEVTTNLTTEEICKLRPSVHSDLARDAQGTIFVKTHNILADYCGHLLHNPHVTSGAIYIVRNPLDVTISLSKYFNYSIDEAIDHMAEEMIGTPNEIEHVTQVISSWSNHVDSWTKNNDPKCLIVKYEDMIDNPLKTFRKVESFLGMKKDPRRLRKAIKFSSFINLSLQENKQGFVEKYQHTNKFFRQGMKNQWLDILNEKQAKKIIDINYNQMVKFKYIPKSFTE